MAQTIVENGVRFVSSPAGGETPGTVYIIGEKVQVSIEYSSALSNVGTPTLGISLGDVGTSANHRVATCGIASNDPRRLLCSYVIEEGDPVLEEDGAGIAVRAGTLRGGNLPSRAFTGTIVDDVQVDGERLAIESIDTGVGAALGFKANDDINLALTFAGDEESVVTTGGFGATLVFDNAERATRFVQTSGRVLNFTYKVVDGDSTRALSLKLSGADALKDKNGNIGLATESGLAAALAAMSPAERRVDTRGPNVTQILFDTAPAVNVREGAINFKVFFDEPIQSIRDASLRITVGRDEVAASCELENAGDEELTCTWTVRANSGLLDTDGLSTPANPLRYDHIRDDLLNDAAPAFPSQRFPDVKVDTVQPTVVSATISSITPQTNSPVVVRLTFSEDVKIGATDPSVNIAIGGVSRPAEYISTSGKTVTFRYLLDDDDVDDWIQNDGDRNRVVVTLMQLTPGDLTDTALNAPLTDVEGTNAAKTGTTFTLRENFQDSTRPRLDAISLVNIPENGVYGGADTELTFRVLFSESVTIDRVSVRFRIGSGAWQETALSSDGTATVPLDRIVDDGAVTVSGLVLAEGASILDGGGADNQRGWQHATSESPIPEGAGGRISNARTLSKSLTGRATVDRTPPKVKSVELLATPTPGSVGRDGQRYYGDGGKVWIKVTMDEDVSIPVSATKPSVTLDPVTGELVTFKALQRKRELIFEYTVDGSDCTGETPTVADKCQIARKGISVEGLVGYQSIEDVGRNACGGPQCGFTAWSGSFSSRHGIDGSLKGKQTVPALTDDPSAPAPTVSPAGTPRVATSTAVPSSGYYTEGDRIRIEIPMTTRVAYTSRPTLIIDFSSNGGGRETANETPPGANSFTGSILTFDYTVRPGDEGTISVTLTGQFTVEDGTRVVLGGARSLPSSYRVDARSPALDSVQITSNAGADDTYKAGDTIIVRAEFTEPVVRTSRTADPTLEIEVGENSRPMTLQSPSSDAGGDTWVFRYLVVAGDNDADGVSIDANALDGDLQDAAGNEATITHSAVSASTSHKVDTQGPSVTAVAVTGSGDDNLFLEGDTITATVTFDEEVDVARTGSNAVRVQFNIGTEPETATYAGGDGTETLTFTYEVVAGDSGQISLPADALEGQVEDAAGNEAEGTLALSGGPYTVDASAPMLVGAPSISSAPRTGDTYAVDETITLQVRFDEPVMVTGEPRLPIQVGPRPRNIVLYTSGSGTDTLTFSYTVRNGDNDDDGVSVDANALRLPAGAAIADVNGLTAAIEHGELPDQPGHKVDAIAPGIESVAITSTPASDDAYLIDEMIEVTVTFSEDIATDGTPTLELMVGDGVRAAACAQGSAGTQLACSYTVMANDFDENGISVDADMLKGTITDMVGNPATLTHEALEDDPAHKVYAAAPEAVRTIDRLSLAAGGGTNSLDLTGIFTGFQLSYAAVSSNESVATATVSGTDLTVVSGMEGTARVTVTASNLAGEASVSFDVLVATDPAETAVLNDALAAIGRSMLSSTASVIGSRFELASTGSQMALGGSRFGGTLSPQMQRFLAGNDPFALEERMSERALFSGSGSQQAHGGGYGLTADRLFTGTSFNMPLNAMGTGDAQFAVWGAGDLQSFEGEPDDGMYDGSSSSGYIGVDARGDGWLAGVSVSRSGAEADYDFDGTARVTGVRGGGTLETSVTAFHPYARLEVGADSEVWVIGGFGGGEADLSRTHVTGSQSSDLSMAMAVGGLRRALAMEFGGADLSLRGDAGFLSLETDSGMMAVDGLSASVSRLRLGLEAAWEGESATPFVEVSGRFDGGDGQTGGGLELAGGLRILNPESGFGLEAKGRILAMHTGDGYSESGIGVTASFEPGAAGRGITFRLSPRWGGSADSTDLFWDEVGNVRDASQYAYGLDRAQTWGVDAALGYGFGLRSMPGVVTPFGQMDVTGDQDQRIRVGVRYGLMQGLLGGTQVELSAERVDGEMHRVGETRVLVSGRARF